MLHLHNMPSTILIYFAFICLLLFHSCKSSNTRYYGVYKAKHSATTITLKEDSTFSYSRISHMNRVYSFGKYKLSTDTVFLFYTDRNYDSTIITGVDQEQLSLSEALRFPRKFIWKYSRLFIVSGDCKITYAKLAN